MASSVDRNCEEPGSFRRSQSRVYFESDISSPTSWEFRGIAGSPIPMRLSALRVSGSEVGAVGGSCSKGEICADGSRNSTGSSTGSHRSQDSGFSDSGGETRGQRRNSPHHTSTHSKKSFDQQELHESSKHVNSPLSDPPTINQSLTSSNSQFHLYHKEEGEVVPEQYFPSPSSQQNPRVTPDCHPVHYTPYLQESLHTNENERTSGCTDCLYQEVILARSLPASPLSPLPPDQSYSVVELGAPTCASTPKRLLQKNNNLHSRPHVMDKIDNFESLNKNKRDNNNNTSFKDGSGAKSPSVGTYDTIKNISIVSTTSVNRISSPTKSSSLYSSVRSGGPSYKSFDSSHVREDVDWNANSSSVVNKSCASYSSRPYLCTPPSPKWQSLPRGYKRIPAPNKTSSDVIVKSHSDNEALRLWIHELRFQAEPECLSTLQTKAISSPQSSNVSTSIRPTFSTSPTSPLNMTTLAIHSVSAPLLSIRNVEQMASVISGEFSNICKHLEFGFFAQIPILVESLSELLGEFLKHFHESFGNLQKLENRLATSCYELRLASRSLNDLILSSSGLQMHGNSSLSDSKISQNIYAIIGHDHEAQFHTVVREIVDRIADLGHLFSRVVDQRLTRDLNSILTTIEQGGLTARVGLQTYATVLQDGGMHICRLAASIRTVRGLLGLLLDSKDDINKILALRCLATVLCVREGLKSFDEAGGFEIIADILYEPMYESPIKYEAVAVLTQATDPWIDLETTLANLSFHLEKIIVSLTNLIPQCKNNEDTFLLTIAAISNLTFLEISSLDMLRRYRTISLILNVMREKSNFSIFILDHVATVLANMAGSERCRRHIVQSGGISALICFLQQRPLPVATAAESSACERLQQKSTIAISRLCHEEGVAKLVLEMNGMQRLIQLCKQEKERHYSDGVLIACLATLRKLVTFCGDGVVQGLHAEDLIQPRLLDSFLLYSSRQESYV